jgi:hypothetical protein
MTYDEMIRQSAKEHLRDVDISYVAVKQKGLTGAILDAIPPLTLKLEDGRFVKVKRGWRANDDGTYDECYLIVEDPE